MNGQLAGKVAIITGAGSGIGKAMADLFAREGAAVTVADVSGAEEKVAADIGGQAQACRVDVSDVEQIDAMFASTLARHRSEEHTSELQSPMRTSYAVIFLKNIKHPTVWETNDS